MSKSSETLNLAIGQEWLTVTGEKVIVFGHDPEKHFFPWIIKSTKTGLTYTVDDNGQKLRRESNDDLVFLLHSPENKWIDHIISRRTTF